MPAVKSNNPLHAEMNRYFNMHVYEWVGIETVTTTVGEIKQPKYAHAGICSANEVAVYIADEKLKIKLFNKALDGGLDRYTFLIRNRLKIEIYSK
ncbi:hypothetical protein GR160_02950 [Flavobacterium sp. Sd200]|uniref:hypothetical protein n=1 Tax=Flavobacterium sp. Sd200 TaxID=2692211 RepID=UPI00136F163A|nr:hypothetical protein [Flavobacterium sp. Sd200]MXN90172.1 hypothetical protein [Flavobacterium sp. Sd200]